MRFEQKDLFGHHVPAGTYRARVTRVRETQSRGGNPMVTVALRIVDAHGSHTVWDYFVTECENPTAVAVSRRRLLELCRACDRVPSPEEEFDLHQLEGHTIAINITVEVASDELRNRVTQYRPLPSATS